MKLHSSIQEIIENSYKGLIPTRRDGKERRALILKTTRKIIAENGIQGVRHRAVAKLAKIPLAATTYYFPDIIALLNDTFLDFCESTLIDLGSLESTGKELLGLIPAPKKIKKQELQIVKDTLIQAIYGHIIKQIKNKEDRIVERAFRNEALRNPLMAKLVHSLENSQLKALETFFSQFGSTEPESDSREMLSLILFLEHRLLAGFITKRQALISLTRLINRMI